MDYTLQLHWRFLKEMQMAAQVDSRLFTLIPSVMFLLGTFILVYGVFHRRTTRMTSTKIWLYRELGFHWTYFYLVRVWFAIIKTFKWGGSLLNEYLEAISLNETSPYARVFIRGIFIFSVFSFSSIPLLIILLKHYARDNVPDFMMWIGQDPWLRSEIGIAGHYLDRPPTFTQPKRKEYAYRSKRSTSTEENLPKEIVVRNCKSMVSLRCVKSIQDLLRD